MRSLIEPKTADRTSADLQLERLISRAADDVARVIGRRDLTAAELTQAQRDAVARSIATQALYLLLLGGSDELGVAGASKSTSTSTDGASAEGSSGASSSTTIEVARRSPRVSPRAIEMLAGHDVIRRSGTVKPPVVESPPAA